MKEIIMSTKIITHKGKKILYADHRGLKGEQVVDSMKEGTTVFVDSKEKMAILAIMAGVTMTKDVLDEAKREEPLIKANVTKQAVLINSPLQEAMLNLYNMFTGRPARAFTSEEAAKDWLVS
jgi:hypothetical protein